MELNEAARAAFNAMREGITIIDTDGIIVFGNTAYREFLNKEAGGDIGPIEGYRLRDLRPGARLPDVLEKGEPILHLTRQEVEDFYFVNLYPIYRDGVLLGGLSVVTFLDDAYRAREELEAMEARSKQVLHRINKANGARYTFDDIVAESPAGAQTKALAFGKTSEEVRAEGTPEAIVSARVFTGNRPTTSIMAPALTPSVLGQLIALYEHITFVEGAVWGIDSFDQWGVELGKVLAKQILPAIEGLSEALDAQDQSTRALIEYYRANRTK